jgi:hypothetical protein
MRHFGAVVGFTINDSCPLNVGWSRQNEIPKAGVFGKHLRKAAAAALRRCFRHFIKVRAFFEF